MIILFEKMKVANRNQKPIGESIADYLKESFLLVYKVPPNLDT